MGIFSRLPEWSLNYQVAALGAYATILLESIYMILRGFEQSSLLSISILTNGSAILFAGFGGASSTPLAALQICLTSLFLLWATFLQGNDQFNGTYAVLCSVAQLTYQLLLRHYGTHPEVLPQHETCTKAEEEPSESCLHTHPTDYNDAANFSGSLRIFFGDAFCLDNAIVPVVILGTVMTYRVLDFDLGFGLVFAFMSAFLSSIVLLFVNSARLRGRQVDTQKSIRVLIGLLLVIGTFCFVLLTIIEVSDPELSWWRIAFGVAWFVTRPSFYLYVSTPLILPIQVHISLPDDLHRLPIPYPYNSFPLCRMQSERRRRSRTCDPRCFGRLCLGRLHNVTRSKPSPGPYIGDVRHFPDEATERS